MMNSTDIVLTSDTKLEDIVKRFDDIPFGNSAFQNINLVLGAQITPERAYRAIGLRLMNRLQALKEAQYSLRKEDIDIEELQEKINSPETNKFDKRRFEIDVEQKNDNRAYTRKLAKDAIVECNTLYSELQKYPEYTAEQFEAGELNHFLISLNRQARGIDGAKEGLLNITHDSKMLPLLIKDPTLLNRLLLEEQKTNTISIHQKVQA